MPQGDWGVWHNNIGRIVEYLTIKWRNHVHKRYKLLVYPTPYDLIRTIRIKYRASFTMQKTVGLWVDRGIQTGSVCAGVLVWPKASLAVDTPLTQQPSWICQGLGAGTSHQAETAWCQWLWQDRFHCIHLLIHAYTVEARKSTHSFQLPWYWYIAESAKNKIKAENSDPHIQWIDSVITH